MIIFPCCKIIDDNVEIMTNSVDVGKKYKYCIKHTNSEKNSLLIRVLKYKERVTLKTQYVFSLSNRKSINYFLDFYN